MPLCGVKNLTNFAIITSESFLYETASSSKIGATQASKNDKQKINKAVSLQGKKLVP